MPPAAPSRATPFPEMIGAMTQCAYELGVAAAGMVKSAGDDTARFLAFSTEFRHCFFAVRMGIRLSHMGVVAPRAAAATVERLERERPDFAEAPERDDARERVETDLDRERDSEPLSLPQFLKSLGVAVAGAEQVRTELPAHIRNSTLPRLKELLGQTTALPELAGVAVLARPPVVPAARSRLLTSVGSLVPPGRRASG